MVCVSEASVGGSGHRRRPLGASSLGLTGPRDRRGGVAFTIDFYPRYVHRERVVTYGQRVAVGDMLMCLSF